MSIALYRRVFEFKVELQGCHPIVWRRFQIGETSTFFELHCAIQSVMGWDNYHLHLFEIKDPWTRAKVEIGTPDESVGWEETCVPSWQVALNEYFGPKHRQATYVYDFGDGWLHKISLENAWPRDPFVYPRLLEGANRCPPEDCGGPGGYADLLEVLKDPEHESYEELLEWAGGSIDPTEFNPSLVRFLDPDLALAYLI